MDMDLFMLIMGEETRSEGNSATLFTLPHIAKEMIESLPNLVWNDKKTFLDLRCKLGVLLVEIHIRLDIALEKMPKYTGVNCGEPTFQRTVV